jgi:hypothetical protein
MGLDSTMRIKMRSKGEVGEGKVRTYKDGGNLRIEGGVIGATCLRN